MAMTPEETLRQWMETPGLAFVQPGMREAGLAVLDKLYRVTERVKDHDSALQSEKERADLAEQQRDEALAEVERLGAESEARRRTLFEKSEESAAEWRRAEQAEAKLAKVVETLESDLAATVSRMDEYVQEHRISKADALHEVIETMRAALAAAKAKP
jgi:hypothetical protein